MSLFSLFLEGILSFLSPCVLPLVPLYMSYLSVNGRETDEEGNVKYNTLRVFLMTVFFVLGISVIFLILALSVNAIRPFIEDYKEVIAIVGGTLIIVFGLHETGIIHINVLDYEKRLNMDVDTSKMTYLKAFILGFLFSFAWSPCIGPMLASAILIASTQSYGALYILVYALGLIIPFLITGLATSFVLNFIRNKKNVLKYVMVIAGVIMIIYGGYMIKEAAAEIKVRNTVSEGSENDSIYLPKAVYTDQNGNTVDLDDYKGKYVVLNFTTTWCGYCEAEIPAYLEFAEKGEDYVCFYVMSPLTSGVSKDEIIGYANAHEINIPVIIDEDNVLYGLCDPGGYPTLFVADKEGKMLGYISGALDGDGLDQVMETARSYE
ncbi:MAG: redoxin domain-containing protein [Erysipelotrichaceae bacterium]|nr:redoxin domain-containing protein [Erysipelotrichaceae bacterium]